MATIKTTVAFNGTAEQEAQLMQLIAENKDVPGALMPVLQQAQDVYGYLPIEVQTMIAVGLNIPLAEVYGVVTFYGQFNLNPKGKYQIAVCMGTACYVKGAEAVLKATKEKLGINSGETTQDGLFSIDEAYCIGACGLAPVFTVNKDVYAKVNPGEVAGILDTYTTREGKT